MALHLREFENLVHNWLASDHKRLFSALSCPATNKLSMKYSKCVCAACACLQNPEKSAEILHASTPERRGVEGGRQGGPASLHVGGGWVGR